MLLGVILMYCFGILGGFWRKIAKVQKLENLGIIVLLRRSVGNPCHGVDLLQSVGYPHRSEVKVPKCHPSGTPRHSIAVARRSYCSQRAIFYFYFFGFLFPNTLYSYTDSI